MKIVIVDYGMGNIRSIIGALKHINLNNIVVSNDIVVIKTADKLILPGVGSFSSAMDSIRRINIDECLTEEVLVKEKPILGICLGMQLMCKSSTEEGFNKGLGFVDGTIKKFTNSGIKIPHIGFNQVCSNKNSKLFTGINPLSDFYFVHSYRMESNAEINQSFCHYDGNFISSYEVGNIAGVQFHPELSQTNGLKLLNNFITYF
jgi:glutamine amidotransferase